MAAQKSKDGVFTLEEVAAHKTNKDCWLIIHGSVCDITEFLEDHPGGDEILMQVCCFSFLYPLHYYHHLIHLVLFLFLFLCLFLFLFLFLFLPILLL